MIPAGALFGRRYCLTLTSDISTQVAYYGNTATGTGGNGQLAGVGPTATAKPTPLRVAFDIQRNLRDSPNRGSIQITNMSAKNRAALRPGLTATLEVGYASGLQTLFTGQVVLIKSTREVSDNNTVLEIMDGDAAISNLVFDKPYAANVTSAAIINDIADFLRQPTPVTPKGISTGPMINLPETTFSAGYTAHGSIRNTLTDLCRTAGLEWSIQNGQLNIVPLNSYSGNSGELISKATGMLGIPSYDGQVLTVQCLLNPRLAPGLLVKVESTQGTNGTFKIRGGKWQGDSHGEQWACEIECIPMGATAATLANTAGNSVKNLGTQAKAQAAAAKKG